MGAALCFPHGGHPQQCLHEGAPLVHGHKYMIRTEVLYPRTAETEMLQIGWIH